MNNYSLKKTKLPFFVENHKNKISENTSFGYYEALIQPLIDELKEFLDGEDQFQSLDFAKSILFPYEIKYNNEVEGYNDSISTVASYAKSSGQNKERILSEQQQRITNLARGYSYILNHRNINKVSLLELYTILSDDILDSDERLLDGNSYRHAPVYIHWSNNPDIAPAQGAHPENVDAMMENLIEYINQSHENDDPVSAFIRSQLIHFQFVYIHPYFDVNGRASRTLGIWYLLNNDAYPFTLFNRAIHHDKSSYYRVIRETKDFKNATFFLKYMLNNVIIELEKEYIVGHIQRAASCDLSVEDRQMLQYMLTNNSNSTLLDLSTFYNRFNPKIHPSQLFKGMMEPLIDKGIVQIDGYSKRHPENMHFSFSQNVVGDGL